MKNFESSEVNTILYFGIRNNLFKIRTNLSTMNINSYQVGFCLPFCFYNVYKKEYYFATVLFIVFITNLFSLIKETKENKKMIKEIEDNLGMVITNIEKGNI